MGTFDIVIHYLLDFKASHSYVERVRRWDWRKKDSMWVDITRFDIDERLYFGDMVASGTWGEPVRIYNEAGYIDIAGDDSVSYHFYEHYLKFHYFITRMHTIK